MAPRGVTVPVHQLQLSGRPVRQVIDSQTVSKPRPVLWVNKSEIKKLMFVYLFYKEQATYLGLVTTVRYWLACIGTFHVNQSHLQWLNL